MKTVLYFQVVGVIEIYGCHGNSSGSSSMSMFGNPGSVKTNPAAVCPFCTDLNAENVKVNAWLEDVADSSCL